MNSQKNHLLIYNKLSKDLGLNFKSQIQNSNIQFVKYLYVTNLISNKETFTLIIHNYPKPLIYQTRIEFIVDFLEFLRFRMDELNKEFEDLNEVTSQCNFYDENYIFMEHERIGSQGQKCHQLLKKFYSFKELYS